MSRAAALLCLGAALNLPAAAPAAASRETRETRGTGRTQMTVETRVAAAVSIDTARATVRDLVALGPRTGGTASGDKAAAAVADRLRRLGLDVVVTDDPPQRTHEESSWQVSLGERALVSAWPWNFSPSIARTQARLVAERPLSVEGAADPRGAVVLAAGGITADLYARMAVAGALALLTDAPADPNRYTDWTPIGTLETLGGAAPALPVFGLSWREGRLAREALARGGDPPPMVTVSLDARAGTGRPRTVIATLPGAGARRDRMVLVCAHGDSDSGGPGADDNASGVATLIEVARALAAAASQGLLPASRPAVRFIVWGAEYHSSRAWAASHAGDLGRLDAVINFDQTGTGAERDAVYFEGDNIPWNAPLLRLLLAAAADHAGQAGFPPVWTTTPALGGTDAYVFLPPRFDGIGSAALRIPTTTVFTAAWDAPMRLKRTEGWRSAGWRDPGDLFVDYSAYYHSSGDVPANTTEAEPWNMERCARVTAVALCRLMRAPAAR